MVCVSTSRVSGPVVSSDSVLSVSDESRNFIDVLSAPRMRTGSSTRFFESTDIPDSK